MIHMVTGKPKISSDTLVRYARETIGCSRENIQTVIQTGPDTEILDWVKSAHGDGVHVYVFFTELFLTGIRLEICRGNIPMGAVQFHVVGWNTVFTTGFDIYGRYLTQPPPDTFATRFHVMEELMRLQMAQMINEV